ncbi:Cytochrome c biogenesis protein CcsA [Salinivirga cyanobacteriivorans]|uniref:Cytochrome c biogenesis protein CcsA n=1 Tax=Salinivirga cyanobacteriivorans TaxID=1307839 RepID=A0A0S2HYG4_9BACT|nr:Cytochrome c biogenesis protein CcsA [Salinivirga cyanobacteriivorans]
MKHLRKLLFSPATMVVLLIMAAFFMGLATFIENDFGPKAAKNAIYNAWWFEVLLFLLAVNFFGSIFDRKLYKKRKWPVLLFHIAFVIILIGAAITRYFGYEGTMHIREGNASSSILLHEKALKVKPTEAHNFQHFFDYDIENPSSFEEAIELDGETYDITLSKNYNAAIEKAEPSEEGKPTIGFVLAGRSYRGFSYITQGEKRQYGMLTVAFSDTDTAADIRFSYKNDTFFIESRTPIAQGRMGDQQQRKLTAGKTALETKKLYQTANVNLVAQELYESANIIAAPVRAQNHKASRPALIFNVSHNNKDKKVVVWQSREFTNNISTVKFGETSLDFAYGYKVIELPFEIYLNDFEIERYPGSHSPSSFSSHVTIYQEGKDPKPYHIYMNNILKMEGYRFYQSSYDKDEKGTILSVNHDTTGTTVTYIGYFLLTLGLLWSLVSKHTFLRNTKIKTLSVLAFFMFLLTPFSDLKAQHKTHHVSENIVSKKHALKFGKLLIQDDQGRTKPVNTLASDIMRKISRKSKIAGMNPAQFFLEMHVNPENLVHIPFIKVGNDRVQQIIGINSNYASYTDIVAPGKGYKLSGMVEKVYAKAPAERNKADKELIKVDERVNICYGMFTSRFLRLFPAKDSAIDKWQTPDNAWKYAQNPEDSAFLKDVTGVYFQELSKAKKSGDYTQATEILNGIKKYQRSHAQYELPSESKINMELTYYRWNIFKKLFPFYATVGLIYLFILVGSIISGKRFSPWLNRSFMILVLIGFLAHTAGLAIRWYISGHAPMSNGYESMIFVSWVTILAGFLFNRYSPFSLAATAILGGFTLMVANLSFMDPQITNLVPVLKSYWLTLHVSVITGSYGFLGLGAILGIINLILFMLQSKKNKTRINETIESLTVINHKTLILGVIFLTIGTFLGAVWANESWGRYWGWDPKETWSLITIIVYTVVTHARLVKNMNGIFVFNVLSVYAFFSVLMTYFGVNYYLSGLHSYAGGDPVPIPTFVYVSIGLLITLSLLSWVNHKNMRSV